MARFAMKKPKPNINVHIPKIDCSVYTYDTCLDQVSKYLLSHKIQIPLNMWLCARMGWWHDFFREIRETKGLNCFKHEHGFGAKTPVTLTIEMSISKLDFPPNTDEGLVTPADSACKSIW